MSVGNVTTPFGRRPMTLALVKGQLNATRSKIGKAVEKWKVFRDVCESRPMLGLQDRALAVLDALLTFYPHSELNEENGLVVFPSNAQLSIRAHGIAGTTLRRHLAALVDAGLISRKDSPNGKRYAHKDRWGGVEEAFGFSLAPLLARAEELALIAQTVAAQRKVYLRTKERLSICRRDVRKLISAAIDEGAPGDWLTAEGQYLAVAGGIPRSPSITELTTALSAMEALQQEVLRLLDLSEISPNMVGNANQNERHLQNSDTESITELEPCNEDRRAGVSPETSPTAQTPLRNFPLVLVMKACPDIADYGPGGMVGNWRDLMQAAVVVRSMLGISPSAYEEACEMMGPENAAVAIACILERSGQINSPGGYLRDLSRRAQKGEFSLGPMLMALLRNKGSTMLKTA